MEPSSFNGAPDGTAPERRGTLAWMVLVCSALAGVGVILYTAARYDAMPDPVPTHFGLTGQPDGWSKKSVGAVMVLPIMTFVMGVTLGGVALLTAHAKRALRRDDGASLAAQDRYRSAISRYLAILGLLVTSMLASGSVATVQVALGQRQSLPGAVLLCGLAIFLYAIGGAGWLAIRYGQGGARLDNAQGTDGLADNPHWKLGVFYVDRTDPSWLVEHRFGFGYTLNFGNPRAVATFALFLGAILALALWAILSST